MRALVSQLAPVAGLPASLSALCEQAAALRARCTELQRRLDHALAAEKEQEQQPPAASLVQGVVADETVCAETAGAERDESNARQPPPRDAAR